MSTQAEVRQTSVEAAGTVARRRPILFVARRTGYFVLPFLIFALGLVLWEVIVRVKDVPNYLLPTPSGIATRFYDDPTYVPEQMLWTAYEAAAGFAIGMILGVAIAIAIAYSINFERIAYPYLVSIQVTPIVAIAPLLVLWFGFGVWPKIIVAALVAFFPIAINMSIGLRSPERDLVTLMRSMAASERLIFWKIRLPYSLPYLFSAIRIAAPAVVIGAIVGEFVSSNKGLGFVILESKAQLDTETLFLAIFASAILGLVMFAITAVLERRLLGWHETQAHLSVS